MPKFEIQLTDAALAGLQRLVAAYNENNGTALSVQEWILLHLKELAIQDDLLRAADELRRQTEQTAGAAVAAERQRLLDSVG